MITEAEGYLDVDEAPRGDGQARAASCRRKAPIVVPLWRAIFNYTDKKIKGFKIHPSAYIDGQGHVDRRLMQ